MKHVYVNGIDIKSQYPMQRATDIEPSEAELRAYGQKFLAEINDSTSHDESINALSYLEVQPILTSQSLDHPMIWLLIRPH